MSDHATPYSRLVFDSDGGGTPRIKATKFDANDVVKWILDGLSWAEILRDHPELTERDISECLQWALEG